MQKDAGLTDTHVDALWLDQANPQVLLATTFYDGIFYTSTGGSSWTNVYPSSATTIVQAGSTLYAATGNGVVESSDFGASWQLIEATTSPVRALAWSGGTLYGGLDNGTIIGQAGPGQPWQTLQTGAANTTAYDIAANPANPKEAIVVLGTPSGLENEVTLDGGGSWSTWNAPPSAGLCNSGGPAKVIAFDTVNPQIIYSGSGGALYVSNNGGTSWSVTHLLEDINLIEPFAGESGTLVVGGDQGIYITQNEGQNWSSLNGNITTSLLNGISVNGSEIFTSVQDFSPIQSFDGGSTWVQLTGSHPPVGENGNAMINPGNPAYQYFWDGLGFQYSTDDGQTFTFDPQLPASEWTFNGNDDTIAVDAKNPSTVYIVTNSGIFKSTDWGINWTLQPWPMSDPSLVVVDPNNSSTIFVGTMPPPPATGAVYVTHNGGVTWSQSSLPPATNGGSAPVSLSIDPNNSNIVVLGMIGTPNQPGDGILVSTDGGATFTSDNVGLATYPFQDYTRFKYFTWAVRFAPQSYPNVVAAATYNGIFVSEAGGPWTEISGNTVPDNVSDIAWSGNTLYTATFGEGVLETPVTSLLSTLAMSPIDLLFPNQIVGSTSTALAVSVTNINGPGSVTLNSITLGGSNATDFVISNGSTCTNGVTLALNGTCQIDITFSPSANGAESATLTISYANGYGNATNILVQGNGVTPPAPTASNGSVTTAENTPVSGILSGSNPCNCGTPVFSIVSQPVHGSAALTNAATGAFTYTPTAGFTGNDSFTFQFGNGLANSATATESIAVTPAAPTANNGSVTIAENAAVNGTLSATGPSGVTLTFAIVAEPKSGTVNITNAATGTFTYTPNNGFAGSDSFTFTASDIGGTSSPATETITVTAASGGGGGGGSGGSSGSSSGGGGLGLLSVLVLAVTKLWRKQNL
ncbi:MAG: Ig-like domain-containing protein [Gammaproteobacteria bacterium]